MMIENLNQELMDTRKERDFISNEFEKEINELMDSNSVLN